MKNLNKIFWQEDKIGMISNHLDADCHSHWMLQLFLSLEDTLNLTVADEKIECQCIVVDKNIPHSFHAGNKVHFSAIIEPTSIYAEQLNFKMNSKGYFICNSSGIEKLQIKVKELVKNSDEEKYLDFIEILNEFLEISYLPMKYDDRILDFMQLLNTCDCRADYPIYSKNRLESP